MAKPKRVAHLTAAACLLCLILASSSAAQGRDSGKLAVFAAASLTNVLPAINSEPAYSFAGSDQLAAQIQFGARADVFAAASAKYPDLLFQKGLVEKPIPFVTNSLVLIVPRSNPARIHTVDDLTKANVKIVIGDASVPVGSYTLTVLKNLGIQNQVLQNVVSKEPDVRGVLAKVALGEADAGFVYVSDARTVKGKVSAIAIRASAQPKVVYEICVLKNAKHLRAAHRFVTALIRQRAQRTFVAYGFGRRPLP